MGALDVREYNTNSDITLTALSLSIWLQQQKVHEKRNTTSTQDTPQIASQKPTEMQQPGTKTAPYKTAFCIQGKIILCQSNSESVTSKKHLQHKQQIKAKSANISHIKCKAAISYKPFAVEKNPTGIGIEKFVYSDCAFPKQMHVTMNSMHKIEFLCTIYVHF